MSNLVYNYDQWLTKLDNNEVGVPLENHKYINGQNWMNWNPVISYKPSKLAWNLRDKTAVVSSLYSQDLIGNSHYCLPYNSYEDISENLVLDQLIIP